MKNSSPADDAAAYAKIKAEAGARRRRASLEGRDIGDIPAVKNEKRRRKSEKSLRYHLEAYYPHVFYLKFSKDHLLLIKVIEETIRYGGQNAYAFARGSGKTSIGECGMEWGAFHGLIRFGVPIGATEGHATAILDSIKADFETNELLLEDFPEVCFPIWALEGIINRCAGQLYKGERTRIHWTDKQIVLPTIAGSKASGAIIRAAGLLGSFRGMKFKRADGQVVRPDFVLADDPQSDESAKSVTQTQDRLRILSGGVLGLAGPNRKISVICPCTVIRPGDLADQLLDRSKNPDWRGQRTKMLLSFPTNEKLWDEYREIRAAGFDDSLPEAQAHRGGAATAFYREHRKEMDEGAVAAWPERFNEGELSAIQHAMNLLIKNRAAFFAEYQNEPLPDDTQGEEQLTVDAVTCKVSGLSKSIVPVACQKLTAFVDVQKSCLFYTLVAWEANFTGYVLDYGTFPDQERSYFSLDQVQKTLQRAFPGAALEGQLYGGLEKLVGLLCERSWQRDDGAVLQLDRLLIDANWGKSTPVVKKFCRATQHARVVMASHGTYVGASSRPFADYRRKPGDVLGLNWRVPRLSGGRQSPERHVLWDTNFWKTQVRDGLRAHVGDVGCLSLWGTKDRASQHLLFAEHCTAEFSVRTQGRGRDVDEWQARPGRDNHWWDCLVGSAVAASMCGVEPQERLSRPSAKANDPFAEKRRLSLSEIQARRRRAA